MDYFTICMFGAGAAIVAWRMYHLHQKQVVEKNLAQTGVPLIGVFVQANSALFEQGGDDLPAQILISFPGPNQATTEELRVLAQQVFSLKEGQLSTPLEKQVAPLVRNEAFIPGKRDKLPPEFTGGKEVYSVGLWIRRNLLPERRLTRPYVHCAAMPGNSGAVAMMPYPDSKLSDL